MFLVQASGYIRGVRRFIPVSLWQKHSGNVSTQCPCRKDHFVCPLLYHETFTAVFLLYHETLTAV